jgi:predicted TIM-barrel fold metal-dependent hydrolase
MAKTIDADTHVDETEETWEYLTPDEQEFKPVVGYPSNPDPKRLTQHFWVIQGDRQPRLSRDDQRTHTTVGTRELLDVPARLRDMDELDVQTHVMYPTLFLVQPTPSAEADLALKRAYNRWLGDRSDQSGGRLRWVCLPPLANMEETKNEMRWAKEHGAVGVFKKGNREANHNITDEYFNEFWQEANDLEMPVCMHIGSGIANTRENRTDGDTRGPRVPFASLPDAFTSLVMSKVPLRYPKIRWGIIEAASGWAPHELYQIRRRLDHPGSQGPSATTLNFDDIPEGFDILKDLFKAYNIFVTCLVDEDLPYILKFIGEDNILVGSDYTHADQSQEVNFQAALRARADAGEISHAAVEKMLYDNPKRLYGL